jgi:hypothetical protein
MCSTNEKGTVENAKERDDEKRLLFKSEGNE